MRSTTHWGAMAWLLGATGACTAHDNVAGSNVGAVGGTSPVTHSTGQTQSTDTSAIVSIGGSSIGGKVASSGTAPLTQTSTTMGGTTATPATTSIAQGATASVGAATGVAAVGGGSLGGTISVTSTLVGGASSGGKTAIGGGSTNVGSAGSANNGAGAANDSGGAGNNAGATSTAGAATGGSAGLGVTVNLDATHQTIQGFGLNVALMPGSLGASVVNTLYGTTGADALGLTIMRIGMNSDGSLSGTKSDVDAAKSAGAKIIGSCWSAPAQCKSNNITQQGGYLLSSCYDSFSNTIVSFAKAQGLYAMSIGNEADFASCKAHGPPCTDDYDTTIYTAKMMADWVKVAGPKLQAAGIKVIAPEASEWIHVWSNASATGSLVAAHPDSTDPLNCGCFSNTPTTTGCAQKCLDGNGYDYGHWLWKDQQAWRAFDILGVHEYDSQMAYAWPDDVNDGKRDKEVWQTEMSGVMYWPEQGPSSDIKNGLAVAGWIHSALTVGEASAWLWWWYQAYYNDDNEGLLLKGSSAKTKRYYTLGNYSRFVRPDYVAVEVAGNSSADLLISAFKGPDDTVVVVAINKSTKAASLPITIAGGTAPATMTPNVTSASENLQAATAIAVSNGTFTASLAAQTVTTYVGK